MIAGDGSSPGFTTAGERRRACPSEQAGTAAATPGAAGLACAAWAPARLPQWPPARLPPGLLQGRRLNWVDRHGWRLSACEEDLGSLWLFDQLEGINTAYVNEC